MRKEALTRAEALFARKEKQKSEGAIATADYLRNQEEQLKNLARLRTMRSERDTAADPGGRKKIRRHPELP